MADSAYERRAMTISPEIETTTPAFVCARCGSRLSRNGEPDALEVGSDSLRTVARHRCTPVVSAPAAGVSSDS
jgi:hypothetical protein